MIKYEIWQLPLSSPYKFHRYEWIKDPSIIKIRDYVLVYAGNITENPEGDMQELLEWIFDILNGDYPDDYYAASLSVSDVVCLIYSANKRKWFYVDGVGFMELDWRD